MSMSTGGGRGVSRALRRLALTMALIPGLLQKVPAQSPAPAEGPTCPQCGKQSADRGLREDPAGFHGPGAARSPCKKSEPRCRGSEPSPTGEYFCALRASARNLCLECGDLGLAAQRHRAHLAVPIERHDDLGDAVAFEQR